MADNAGAEAVSLANQQSASAAQVAAAQASAGGNVAAAIIAAMGGLGQSEIGARSAQNVAGMNIASQLQQLAARIAADRELEQMRLNAQSADSQRQIDLMREQIGADMSKLSMSLQAQYADMAEKYGIERARLAFDQQVQQAKEFGSPRDWVSASYFYRNAQNPSPTGSLNYQVPSRPNYNTDPNFGTNVPSGFSGIGGGKGGYPTGPPMATAQQTPASYNGPNLQSLIQSLPPQWSQTNIGTGTGITGYAANLQPGIYGNNPIIGSAAGGNFPMSREPSGPTPGGVPVGTTRQLADGSYVQWTGTEWVPIRAEPQPGPFQGGAPPRPQDPSTLPQAPNTGFTGGMTQGRSAPPSFTQNPANQPRPPSPSQQSAARAASIPAPGVATPPANVSAVSAFQSGALEPPQITAGSFPSSMAVGPPSPPPTGGWRYGGVQGIQSTDQMVQGYNERTAHGTDVPPPPGSTYMSPGRVLALNPDGSGDHVEMYFDPSDSQWHQVTTGNMGPGRTNPYGPGIPGYNLTGPLPPPSQEATPPPTSPQAAQEKPYNPLDYISPDDLWGKWIGMDPVRSSTIWRPTPQTPYISPSTGIGEAPDPSTLNNPGTGRAFLPPANPYYSPPDVVDKNVLSMTGPPSPDNPPQPGMKWNPATRTWEYPTGPSFSIGGRAEGGPAINSMVVGETGPELLNFTKSGANIDPLGPAPNLPGTPQYNLSNGSNMPVAAPANKAASMVMPQPTPLPVKTIQLPPWMDGLVKGAAEGTDLSGRPVSPISGTSGTVPTAPTTGVGGDATTMPNPYTQLPPRPTGQQGPEAPSQFGYFDANNRYVVGQPPAQTGNFYGWTPEALANMPWLQALSKNSVMPAFQAYGGPLNLNQMPGGQGMFPGLPDVPAPHQIAPQAWMAMSPTEQSMALAYYQALGFEPETVMKNIQMSTPGTTRSDRTFWRT